MYRPLLIVPTAGLKLHVTAPLLAPETDAENCCVCDAVRVVLVGVSDTVAGMSFIAALADLVVSAALVAVTIIVCAEPITAGAVYKPLALIVPIAGLRLQVTLVLTVPVRVGVNCWT